MEVRGLGQLLAALAAAFFVRAIRGPGPALLPPADDTEDDETDTEAGEGGGGGVPPVTIRWARITCALKNKRGEVVSSLHRRYGTTSGYPQSWVSVFIHVVVSDILLSILNSSAPIYPLYYLYPLYSLWDSLITLSKYIHV
jgi:hypothetical protein